GKVKPWRAKFGSRTRAVPHCVAGSGRLSEQRDLAAHRNGSREGRTMAPALCKQEDGRHTERQIPPGRNPGGSRSAQKSHYQTHPARQTAWSIALEPGDDGPRSGSKPFERWPYLGRSWVEASSGQNLQALQRQALCGEA